MTSVTIDDETHRLLEKLKKERGKKSFNDLLKDIAERELEIPDSLFGELQGIGEGKVREKKDRTDG